MAVSYTHLDVYKRQVRKLIDRRIERALNSSYAEVAAAMPFIYRSPK